MNNHKQQKGSHGYFNVNLNVLQVHTMTEALIFLIV